MSNDNDHLKCGVQPSHELRSFGRRRGRKRSARQDSIFVSGLARWGLEPDSDAPLALDQMFAFTPTDVWLEIGFGGGEHLIWQADRNPGIGFIGAEPFEDGVVKVLTAIEEKHLQNIRVYPGDVRKLFPGLPPNSIGRAFILFPDPWPKARHQKRRLVSPAMLTALSRVLVDGAELRIATDIPAYAADILAAMLTHPSFVWEVAKPNDWRQRPNDWPATRYEAKALSANRTPNFFRFRHIKFEKQGDYT